MSRRGGFLLGGLMQNNLLLLSLLLNNRHIIKRTFTFTMKDMDSTLSVNYDKMYNRIYINQNNNPVCVINPTWLLEEIKNSRREE